MSRLPLSAALALTACLALASGPASASPRDEVLTIDHGVPHISSVPAIEGEEVLLFVRERVAARMVRDGELRKGRPRSAQTVLFVHGASVPVVSGLDLDYEDYGWAEYLAKAGFDVFLLDLNGYGFSPRPTMDNPCNANPGQQDLLVPNPLAAPCSPDYLFQLNTIESERDEIDTVIDYIRELRGVDRVSLIGWSLGGLRTGTYTALHPDKVENLIILASCCYDRTGSSEPPAELPAPGAPMSLQTYDGLIHGRWLSTVACEDQVERGIETVAWNDIMRFDPLGSTWGTPPWNPISSPTGGLMRVAQWAIWGWNAEAAAQIEVPTLIMVGEQDGLYDSNVELFEDLGTTHKVFLGIACATHFVSWERQHEILQEASEDWLRRGRVKGLRNGVLHADPSGGIQR